MQLEDTAEPPTTEYRPAAQPTHPTDPVLGWYVPVPQSEQLTAPTSAWNLPVGQLTQEVDEATPVTVE